MKSRRRRRRIFGKTRDHGIGAKQVLLYRRRPVNLRVKQPPKSLPVPTFNRVEHVADGWYLLCHLRCVSMRWDDFASLLQPHQLAEGLLHEFRAWHGRTRAVIEGKDSQQISLFGDEGDEQP